MFGIKTSLPPGKAAAHEIFKGFATFDLAEKELVAGILVKIAPGLAAQGDTAQRLPMGKIMQALKAAFGVAWTGIMKPKKLVADLVDALETESEGKDLREFCAAVGNRCAGEVEAANIARAAPALAAQGDLP
jgi:hypothetical protein